MNKKFKFIVTSGHGLDSKNRRSDRQGIWPSNEMSPTKWTSKPFSLAPGINGEAQASALAQQPKPTLSLFRAYGGFSNAMPHTRSPSMYPPMW